LLDEAERGQTVVVTRGGRRVASLGPVAAGNGVEVIALLSSPAADDGFAPDVRSARDAASLDGPAWPDG